MSEPRTRKVDDFLWELPIGFVPGMRVPGRVFASEKLFRKALEDKAVEQVANVQIGDAFRVASLVKGTSEAVGGVVGDGLGLVRPALRRVDLLAAGRAARQRRVAQDKGGPATYDYALGDGRTVRALLSPMPILEARVRDILRRAAGRSGHIFNLGHGVLQQTDPARLKAVVEMVHQESAAGG